MVTQTIPRRRRPRGIHPKRTDREVSTQKLPEYLEADEVAAIIRAADDPRARLLMMEQWRARLRVSEALALEVSDLSLDANSPTLKVRSGKGRRARVFPVHPVTGSCLQDGAFVRKRERGQTDRRAQSDGVEAGGGARSDTARQACRNPHAAPQLRSSPADARHPDQLPVSLAGTLGDPDDADLPAAGAGSDRESGIGAVTIPADIAGLAHTTDIRLEFS